MKTALVFALLSFSTVAAALDVKGVSRGDPYDQQVILKKLNDYKNPDGSEILGAVTCDEYSCSGYTMLGSCHVRISVDQENGKVEEIFVNRMDPACGMLLEPLLTKKYGPPTTVNRDVLQNAYGAKVSNFFATWVKGRDKLTYTRRFDMTQGALMLGPSKEKKEEGSL